MKTEKPHGYGAIRLNRVHRGLRRVNRSILGQVIAAAGQFDWVKGYDIETVVGKIPIKDQGTTFSCAGQSSSYFLEVQQRLKGNIVELSAKSMYAPIHYSGGGTTVGALETQLAAHGANLETEVPSYQNGNLPGETFMEDTSWLTNALAFSGQLRAGFTPMNVQTNPDAMAEAIQNFGGIIIEITGQNNGTWDSDNPQPPSKANPNPFWHHFIYACKARTFNNDKQIGFLQSWGTDVGENGIQWLGSNYTTSPYILECITFVKDNQLKPIPGNTSIWAILVTFFQNLFKINQIA